MKTLLTQLKWQFLLLHKNNIITISLGITFIYGAVLFFVKDLEHIDKVLVSIVLNDPSVIGYFFVALAIYTERSQQILPAIFTSPINLHHYLIAKVLALSIIGLICSLGLAFAIKGMDYGILNYTIGAFGICLLSALLSIMMMTFFAEFLKFAMFSGLLFLLFIDLPMLQYLGAVDMSFFKYLFPIEGCIELIDNGISGISTNFYNAYLSILFWIPLFYWGAYSLFSKKIVHQ